LGASEAAPVIAAFSGPPGRGASLARRGPCLGGGSRFRVGRTRLQLCARSSGTAAPPPTDRRGARRGSVGASKSASLNLDLAHVPFGGAGPAVVSVVGGDTPIGFSSLAAALPQIKDGKLRALAVTSKTRSGALPEVPTMAEAGYPAIVGDSWVGVLVPPGTSKAIVTVLNREIVRIIGEAR
jgi:hypothetical protein